MSTDEFEITEEEARREAERVLRFKIGTFPRLGSVERDGSEYVYEIIVRLPRVIFDQERENPVGVRYLSATTLGEIRVNAESGDIERPNRPTIERKIREHEEEVEYAVQRAVVGASTDKLALLPFPETRYAPIQDVLAQVILEDKITDAELDQMSGGDGEKYRAYIDDLVQAGLLRRREGAFEADDSLITIQRDEDKDHAVLEKDLGIFFKENAGDIEMVRSIMGPYLTIAGYYYRRALEAGELPVIDEEEIRGAINSEYRGSTGRKKLFKLSRYLLQLEEVGILKSRWENGKRVWYGTEDIHSKVMDQRAYLTPIAGTMA